MLRMITAAREGAGGGVTDYMARLGKGGGEAVADYSPRKNLQYKLFFIGPASDFSGCGTGHARIPAMLHAG